MKIAVEIKEEAFDKIMHDLELGKYEVGGSSNKFTIWVYNIKVVQFMGKHIQIEHNNTFNSLKIDLNDVEYFEVSKEA